MILKTCSPYLTWNTGPQSCMLFLFLNSYYGNLSITLVCKLVLWNQNLFIIMTIKASIVLVIFKIYESSKKKKNQNITRNNTWCLLKISHKRKFLVQLLRLTSCQSLSYQVRMLNYKFFTLKVLKSGPQASPSVPLWLPIAISVKFKSSACGFWHSLPDHWHKSLIHLQMCLCW